MLGNVGMSVRKQKTERDDGATDWPENADPSSPLHRVNTQHEHNPHSADENSQTHTQTHTQDSFSQPGG